MSPKSARKTLVIWLVLAAVLYPACSEKLDKTIKNGGVISGELKKWYIVTIDFAGPEATESDNEPNPFLDYRLNVEFVGPSGSKCVVPGFFDGDGKGNGAGSVWRVRFAPDEAGKWKYTALFREGKNIAIVLYEQAGQAKKFDGAGGTFEVAERDCNAEGFLKWGRLEYAGGYYLKFRDGGYWIKGGTDSPENFLGYYGFDGTTVNPKRHKLLHDYDRHIQHWTEGDPEWGNRKGKGIIGALNYLSSKKVNSLYALLMNIGGDGKDVWPFAGKIDRNGSARNDNLHFDISKLYQWEIVFGHAQKKGINLNLVFNESEKSNKQELDNAGLGIERKLYYREMLARFGHHNALQWMLCEEYDHPKPELEISPEMVKSWAGYISAVDAYDHPLSVHNCLEDKWQPFYGDERFDLTSYQAKKEGTDYGRLVESMRQESLSAGRKIAICIDETVSTLSKDDQEHQIFDHGNWQRHIYGQSYIRKNVIYPIYFSGGAVELILERTLETDDFTKFRKVWDYMYYARKFMQENLRFWEMSPADELLGGKGEVLARHGWVYAIYLPEVKEKKSLNLRDYNKKFEQRWYNPRMGEFEGPTKTITGGHTIELGEPPHSPQADWVVFINSGKNPDLSER